MLSALPNGSLHFWRRLRVLLLISLCLTTALFGEQNTPPDNEAVRKGMALLDAGEVYLRAGRPDEAAGFYVKAIELPLPAELRSRIVRALDAALTASKVARDAEWNAQLRTAEALEKAENWDAAQASFLKLAQTPGAPNAAAAETRLHALLRARDQFPRKYVLEPFATAGGKIVETAISVLLSGFLVASAVFALRRIFRSYRQGKISVQPLTDATDEKLACGFGDVMSFVADYRRRAARLNRPLATPTTTDFQVVVPVEAAGEEEETFSLVNEDLGKLMKFVKSVAFQAEYRVGGSLRRVGTVLNMVVYVKCGESTIRIWDRTFAEANLLAEERQMAYEVLLSLEDHTA
jgi:hypothetical protein